MRTSIVDVLLLSKKDTSTPIPTYVNVERIKSPEIFRLQYVVLMYFEVLITKVRGSINPRSDNVYGIAAWVT